MENLLKQINTHTSEYGNKVYDIYALRNYAESLPVEIIPIESLSEAVGPEYTYWLDQNGVMFGPSEILKDWEVAQSNPLWQEHISKLKRVNIDTPIWLAPDGTVFDGVHRLTRAFIEGVKEIKVRKFKEIPESAIVQT